MTWSIEKAELIGEVYDRHLAAWGSSYATLEDLEREWSDGHYVWTTHERLEPLVNAFERLWLLSRMLRIDTLPLKGRDNSFVSRAEWLRITHEIILVRLAGIRDLAALLVSVVLELGLPVYRVSIRALLRSNIIKSNVALVAALKRLAGAVPDLRNERNTLVHQGVRRAFGDYQLFDHISHMEALGNEVKVEPWTDESGHVRTFDLLIEQRRISAEFEAEFSASAMELREIVLELLAILVIEWRARFSVKAEDRANGAAEQGRRPRRPPSTRPCVSPTACPRAKSPPSFSSS